MSIYREAPFAAAKVTAAPKNGDRTQSALTNSFGLFSLPALDAADYVVRVDVPGFTPPESILTLLIRRTAALDLQLHTVTTSSSVDVLADTAVIDTSSSLNGRNWMELALLVSGITKDVVGFTPLGATTASMAPWAAPPVSDQRAN